MCHGHCEALYPFLSLGRVFRLQYEGLVSGENLEGLGNVPPALDIDAPNAADVDGEDSLLLGLVLVRKPCTR